MNLKKIVSVLAAASMLAAMAVNASAYQYTSATVQDGDNDVTTLTWDFVTDTALELKDTSAEGEYNGLTVYDTATWQFKAGSTAEYAEGLICKKKNNNVISYTAPEDGVLTVYGNGNDYCYIYSGTLETTKKTITDVVDNHVTQGTGSGNEVQFIKAVTKGTTYNVYNSKDNWKISKVTFVSTKAHETTHKEGFTFDTTIDTFDNAAEVNVTVKLNKADANGDIEKTTDIKSLISTEIADGSSVKLALIFTDLPEGYSVESAVIE